ncbi:hypothetical protein OLZ32_34635 [Rhizobium sp. 1AS11]|uniref:hypothetical protein n=1 Tax=Rhizobium acaciae TaxID=2989736 RepID=UPI002223927E|nr:hypothetical protein [Rhizobium acaciae]MCW1413353.1 hypothetical protein [Rhizobium acaciae]MCW1745503.1 hypothetical protein [Rhizobium acaciae]
MNKTIEDTMVSGLRGIYKRDNNARAMLDSFAARKKAVSVSYADRIAFLVKLSYSEVIRIFKELEGIGCGEFKNGRKGYKTRMEWSHSLISLGEVAKGEAVSVEAINPDDLDAEDDADVPGEVSEQAEGFIQHPFQLRPDQSVTLSLPADLTMKEAQRLAAFIQTIPFE